MGILSMISFVVSLICISVIVGFKNSTHQVQYVPLNDQPGEDDAGGLAGEKSYNTEEEPSVPAYILEKRRREKLNKWKEFTGSKQEAYEEVGDKL